jgi:CubicO group peptidase (beta-lactamase class C family)
LVAVVALSSACASPLLGRAAGGMGGPGGTTPADCGQPKGSDPMGTTEPAAVGMDSETLKDAVQYSTDRGAQSLRVYRHGCLVVKSGNDPVTETMRLQSFSMTKGMVSLVVGRAVELGLLDIDDPIGEHLEGLEPAKAALTIRQFLNQTTGLKFAYVNDFYVASYEDSVKRTLERPIVSTPGTKWVYAQTTVTVLVAVVEAAAGMDFQEFFTREITEPLGIPRSQWRWDRDGSGRTQGFAFLEMAPVAWARIGQLMLDEGSWQGQQLVNDDYIAQGSRGTQANPGYGFLWSTGLNASGEPLPGDDRGSKEPFPPDSIGFNGLFEQKVEVIPSLDMVIVRMGPPTDAFGDPLGESPGIRPNWEYRFSRMLMQAVTDVEVPDPGPWKHVKADPFVDPNEIVALDMYPFG